MRRNTHNRSRRVWPLAEIEALAAACRELEIALHIDGARLFNAAVASGQEPPSIARHGDTVTICFSKGLGCPFGAVVAGSGDRMLRARRFKHQFGGAMSSPALPRRLCVPPTITSTAAGPLAAILAEVGRGRLADIEQVETNSSDDVGALGSADGGYETLLTKAAALDEMGTRLRAVTTSPSPTRTSIGRPSDPAALGVRLPRTPMATCNTIGCC